MAIRFPPHDDAMAVWASVLLLSAAAAPSIRCSGPIPAANPNSGRPQLVSLGEPQSR